MSDDDNVIPIGGPRPARKTFLANSLEVLARAFAKLHEGELCTARGYREWLCWSPEDGCWIESDALATNACGEFVKMMVERLAPLPATQREQQRIGAMVFPILRRAASLLWLEKDVFDRDPWLLNTPGGTVDLRTGEIRPHRASDYITRCTAVTPSGEACLWDDFLDTICDGDHDLAGYLQRMAGYACTGSTREQCLFFLYGTGQNGKGVFVHTLAQVLRDYATSASVETFSNTKFEKHREELARLRGARLVCVSETSQGRAWNEQRLKEITGGDTVTANFMRHDSFDFVPSCKLLISGNHQPTLWSNDKAMRRRLNLIPFAVEITDERRDPDFEMKLVPEWPGILRWMIDGARLWHERRLQPPEVVVNATSEYISDQDSMGSWIEENCDLSDPQAFSGSNVLFKDWVTFAENCGERPGAQRTFVAELKKRGKLFNPPIIRGHNKTRTMRGFIGIRLKIVMA